MISEKQHSQQEELKRIEGKPLNEQASLLMKNAIS